MPDDPPGDARHAYMVRILVSASNQMRFWIRPWVLLFIPNWGFLPLLGWNLSEVAQDAWIALKAFVLLPLGALAFPGLLRRVFTPQKGSANKPYGWPR